MLIGGYLFPCGNGLIPWCRLEDVCGSLIALSNTDAVLVNKSKELFLHSRNGYTLHSPDNYVRLFQLIDIEIQKW